MRKKFLPFSLLAITSVLLASCNQTPSLEAANNQNQVPALMSRAEEVPQALGQLIALNNSVKGQKLEVSSIKAQSSLSVTNPDGIKVMRVEVTGPEKVDLLSGQQLSKNSTYAFVGATSTQDGLYRYGLGQELGEEFSKTLKAIGGKDQVDKAITYNLLSIVLVTKNGQQYLVGQDKPMTDLELSGAKEEYRTILDAYRDKPEGFEKNQILWKKLASSDGVAAQSLKTASISAISNLDGSLNLQKALGMMQSGLSAQEAKLMPQALNALAYDGRYDYNASRATLSGGGYAQSSTYWGVRGPSGSDETYLTYPFILELGNDVVQPLIGCSAASAQSLIFNMWKAGYSINYKGIYRSWSYKAKQYSGNSQWYGNDRTYDVNSSGYVNNQYGGLTFENDDNEFVPLKILNEKTAEGRNFSTVAMNAGVYDGTVANKVNDIPRGLGIMLNKIWPWMGEQNVWYEWKTAGKGSTGTMREILATNLPAGRVVMASYPTGGFQGHTSTVTYATLTSYWGGWAQDAYIATYDHPNSGYLVTGYNVPASGIYSVNY